MPDDTFTETIAKGGKKAAESAADTFEDTGDALRTATRDIGALASAAQADTKEARGSLPNTFASPFRSVRT